MIPNSLPSRPPYAPAKRSATRSIQDRLAEAARCKKDDPDKAYRLYSEMAKEIPEAQYQRGLMHTDSNWANCDYKLAHEYLLDAVSKGIVVANRPLGFLYVFGRGVPQNTQTAFNYFAAAAETIPGAYADIGTLHYFPYPNYGGLFIECNYVEAYRYFKKAADWGDGIGLHALGRCYEFGHGTQKNVGKAFKCYRDAAHTDLAGAWLELARCYERGECGVSQDRQAAMNCKKLANNLLTAPSSS
jgi:TPR repeat protein